MQTLGIDTRIVDLEMTDVPVHQVRWFLLLELKEGHGVVEAKMSGDEDLRYVQLVLSIQTLADFSLRTFGTT